MDASVLGVILSGQLLVVVWQIVKEIADRREKKKQAALNTEDAITELKHTVFKLYRDSMERKILDMYIKVDNDTPDLREALMALQDDMEFYIQQGGNGRIKELYLHLQTYVRTTKGESYYILMLVDQIQNAHD